MASIMLSLYTLGPVQKDGRVEVIESLTDNAGKTYRQTYLAADGYDYDAHLAATAARIIASADRSEYSRLLKTAGPLTFAYGTVEGLLADFRQRFLYSTGIETCYLSRWLVDQLAAGRVTVTQCRAAWGGINTAAWNSINGRMDTYAAAYTSTQTAVGE